MHGMQPEYIVESTEVGGPPKVVFLIDRTDILYACTVCLWVYSFSGYNIAVHHESVLCTILLEIALFAIIESKE